MSSFLMSNKSIATLATYLERLYNNGFELCQQELNNQSKRVLQDVCKPYTIEQQARNGYTKHYTT
jgi:hypothetical protein